MDQTYDRLLLAIPDDEKLFVLHALCWISTHSTFYNEFEMPLVILSRAAEASAARASKQSNDRFYDCETLRDFCGCLIRVNTKTEGVTFAHYTVQEYLYRTRVFQGILERLNHPFFLDFIYTETLRIHQEDLSTQKYDFQHENFAIDAHLNGNVHIYYAISSIASLNRGTDWTKQINVSLIVDLLDPSRSHISALRRVLSIISKDHKWGPLLAGAIAKAENLWTVEWDPDLDAHKMGPMHLLNVMFGVPDATNHLVLVEHILRNRRSGSAVFEAELGLTFPAKTGYSYKAKIGYGCRDKFCGTIMEILPQLCSRTATFDPLVVFYHLLQQHLVKRCDIAIYIAWHYHTKHCQDFCALQHLLSIGGDPNGSGYRITPLQISVHKRDEYGVNMLLKAGADPNGTGDRSGRVWKDEIMSTYNGLIGASPLRISRKLGPTHKVTSNNEMSKIVDALLQYGARDFEDGLEADCRHK